MWLRNSIYSLYPHHDQLLLGFRKGQRAKKIAQTSNPFQCWGFLCIPTLSRAWMVNVWLWRFAEEFHLPREQISSTCSNEVYEFRADVCVWQNLYKAPPHSKEILFALNILGCQGNALKWQIHHQNGRPWRGGGTEASLINLQARRLKSSKN